MLFLKLRAILLILPVAIWLCIASEQAHAALYGAQPDTGQIAEIDPLTGAVVRSFTAPDPTFDRVGLSGANSGAVLLWRNITGSVTLDRLTRIDPSSGGVIGYDNGPSADDLRSLDFQTIGGHSYILHGTTGAILMQDGFGGSDGAEYNIGNSRLRSLGGDGFGRAFNASADGIIREYNPLTADILNSFTFSQAVTGMAFDGVQLYVAWNSASNAAITGMISTVNPDTGAVLRSVAVDGGRIGDLAVANVPEPIVCIQLVLSALPLLRGCRRGTAKFFRVALA